MSGDITSSITDQHYNDLKTHLASARTIADLYEHIVNAPFADKLLTTSIDLGVVVLLAVNKKDRTIDRLALSDTELARSALQVSAKPFHTIRIPLSTKNNCIASAIRNKKYEITEDWNYLFTPVLTPEEARRNQAAASIECSLVWPLTAGAGGALIFSFFQPLAYIGATHLDFAEKYAALVDKALAKKR